MLGPRSMVTIFIALGLAAGVLARLPDPGLEVTVDVPPAREDERIVILYNRDHEARSVLSARPSCKCVTILNTSPTPVIPAGGRWSLRVRLELPVPDRVIPGVNLAFEGEGEAALFVPVLNARST